jgi:photosystem II stability/assembly factor-like uncharacterized protein
MSITALQATAGKRLGWQVGCQRLAVPELIRSGIHQRKSMTAASIPFTATLIVVGVFTNFAAAADAYAVFKSGDRGRSWTRSDTGMPHNSRINAFGSAAESLFAGRDSGIYISMDEALTWQPATGAAMSSGRIISFATVGQIVLAGTDGAGMLQSGDGGKSWEVEDAFPCRKVRCLLAHGGRLYAGTDAEGVLASSDAGQTWIRMSAGLPSRQQVFALSAVGSRVFAGLYSRGLYAWDEMKESWAKTGPVTPLALASIHGTLIAGHNPGGLYWSGDWGASWSKGAAEGHAVEPLASLLSVDSGELPSEAPVWELGSDDGLVLAGASAGIYYSDDRGRTWTRARTGLPEESPGIAFLLRRDFMLAGTLIKRTNGEPLLSPRGQ